MSTIVPHHRRRAVIPPGDSNHDTARVFGPTEFAAPGVPFDPRLDLISWVKTGLLFATVLVAFLALAREAHAQPTAVLLSNGGPPPSSRLLLVNVAQRHVAQEFTTGPHPGGYDIYAVAIRTEDSSGKHNLGLQGVIRTRRSESAGPWHVMMPHRQIGPPLTRSRPVSDYNWSWFMSSEPIHLEPNETYFFELACSWGCFAVTNRVGLGLTESNDEDDMTLPGWSMANGFMIQNSRFNRWWGDMVVGSDGFFHPNPQGPVLRLEIRGEPTEIAGLPTGGVDMPQLSASDVQVREAPNARLAFPITLSSASTSPVTVLFKTADGTATAGRDYVPTSGRLVFAPGQTQHRVAVPVFPDARKEDAETLTLHLSSAMGARLVDSEATGTIVNAAPRTREWMARHEQSLPRQETDAAAELNDPTRAMSAQYVEMEPLSPGAVQTQDALAAHGEEPAWEDAGRSLVGTWSSRFGAMPVPPVTPTDGVDSGESRALASNGRQMPGDRTPAGRSLVHVSAHNARAPVLVDWGLGVREGFAAHAYDTAMAGDATAQPPARGFDHGGRRVAVADSSADQSAGYRSPAVNGEKAQDENAPTSMSPCLRLALSEPISSWGSLRCDGG